MKHIASKDLLQFCEGALDPVRATQIREHVDACAVCKKECEEIRLSMVAARELAPARLSDEATERIRRILQRKDRERKSWFADPRFRIATAIAAAYVVVTLVLQIKNPGAKVHAVTGSASQFEEVALANYHRYLAGSLEVDLATGSPQEARQWIGQQGNFSAPLAVNRPLEDGASFQLQGARRIPYDGRSALLVTYRIDDHPVLLLTARAESVSSAPKAGLFSKSIYVRSKGDLKLLTWSSSGNVYTLVSNLPNSGRRSCYICHTDRAHRKKIDQAF